MTFGFDDPGTCHWFVPILENFLNIICMCQVSLHSHFSWISNVMCSFTTSHIDPCCLPWKNGTNLISSWDSLLSWSLSFCCCLQGNFWVSSSASMGDWVLHCLALCSEDFSGKSAHGATLVFSSSLIFVFFLCSALVLTSISAMASCWDRGHHQQDLLIGDHYCGSPQWCGFQRAHKTRPDLVSLGLQVHALVTLSGAGAWTASSRLICSLWVHSALAPMMDVRG